MSIRGGVAAQGDFIFGASEQPLNVRTMTDNYEQGQGNSNQQQGPEVIYLPGRDNKN